MLSRKPPSLRDPQATEQRLARAVRTMIPGSAGGRVAAASLTADQASASRRGGVSGVPGDDHAGTGNLSMAVGPGGTTATNSGSTAVGYDADATGIVGTALGYGARATGGRSTALGGSANALGLNSTAVGEQAVVTAGSDDTTIVGRTALASGVDGVAVGTSATVNGAEHVAVGRSANARGSRSTAVGCRTFTRHLAADNVTLIFGQTAVGYGATTDASRSTAIGSVASAFGVDQVVIGADSGINALYPRSIVIGVNHSVSAPDRCGIKANELEVTRSNGAGATSGIFRSPDGTRWRLQPPNGGGAATWVAA